ncbi:MAG: family 78 glycoside hydrolase catalytic domain [bacterium]|nr:family 78 glycoside hydrolase catalytic domain [bacterium]
MFKLSNLKINYQKDPVGISSVWQIGWQLEADRRGVFQKSYQVQLAEDCDFEMLLYDSDVVDSDESAHVQLDLSAGLLSSMKRYWLRARVWTTQGEESHWQVSSFVTSLLSNQEWNAKFITIETEGDSQESRGFYLRREFSTGKQMKAAYVCSTALGLYHLYLNGKRISTDEMTPGWTSYRKHLLYQTYDVTQEIREGRNVIGAMVGAGWYKGEMGFLHQRNNYGEVAAFSARLAVEYTDGSREWLITDETWCGAFGPILFSEIYDGEIYDARKEISNWSQCECTYMDWMSVHNIDFPEHVLTPQAGCRVREITKVPAKEILTTPEGDTVINFGQNMTGWVNFEIKGYAGARVELNCFEVLDSKGNVYLDNLRKAKATLIYICKDDQAVRYKPNFTYQGFQYVRVKEYPGAVRAEKFTAYAVHSDMEETGTFSCSNQDLNQLHHNIVWGMKGNFLDVPTDCPQRDERVGWTGDAQIFCRTASYLMDTYTFYTKWLRDVAADQTEEGGVPHIVPDFLIGKNVDDWLVSQGAHSAAAWADVAVIMPWTLYLMYGDTKVIRDQYESMKAWICFMQTHAVDHIWNYKLQFGDWVALDAEEGSYFGATPNDLTCTAYYAYSTGLFAKMAAVIGNEEDAVAYRKLYQEIVEKYQSTFFDRTGHLTAQTQTAQIVTLYFGLAPEAYHENVVQDLLKLLKKENGHLVTGFVGTPYFCHALSENGHTEEAYDLLLKDDFPSWLYQVKMGATTVWEHWDGLKPDGTMWSPDMNSFNHYAYGAVAEWLYRVGAGIECDEQTPGFRHFMIAPHIGGRLSFMNVSYRSIYGTIVSDWKTEYGRTTLHIEIPGNTTADICLTGAVQVTECDGLEFISEPGHHGNPKTMTARAVSGSYTICYKEADHVNS